MLIPLFPRAWLVTTSLDRVDGIVASVRAALARIRTDFAVLVMAGMSRALLAARSAGDGARL
jgi:hypothetical protein